MEEKQNNTNAQTPEVKENISDILSSIKDVINSDSPAEDVLELTDIVKDAAAKAAAAAAPAPKPDETPVITVTESKLEPFTPAVPTAPVAPTPPTEAPKITEIEFNIDKMLQDPPATNAEQPSDQLLDKKVIDETRAAVTSILKPTKQDLSPKFRSGTTVETLIIEMLQPELKAWLNEHLPSIVKHVVEKEVRKILPKDE